MIGSIERKQRGPPVDARLEVHRAGPEAVQVSQRVLGVVELQVDSEMVMVQVKLASVPIVAILDPNDRLAEIGQTEQKTLLDLLELAALDLIHLGLIVVSVTE